MSRLIVIDLETTGLDPRHGARIWQLGVAEVPQVSQEAREAEGLFAPPVRSWGMNIRLEPPVSEEEATVMRSISGLTDPEIERLMTEDATSWEVAMELLILGWCRVQSIVYTSFNRNFDYRFLAAEIGKRCLPSYDWAFQCRWHGQRPDDTTESGRSAFDASVDPMAVAARHFAGHPGIKRPGFMKLDLACELLNVPRGGHRAQADAVAAARVAAKLGMGQE